MASSQTFSFSHVTLVALMVWLYPGHGEERSELCDNLPSGYCYHSQSGMCGRGKTSFSCNHQLHQKELLISSLPSQRCQMNVFVKASGCGSLQPSQVYAGERPLVGMHLYHYRTWIGQWALVNFTFPYPDWNDLKLQYKVNRTETPKCLQFRLRDMSLPLNDTLVYDCVVFDIPGKTALDAEVTLVNNRGDGRTFIFRLPSQSRIDPNNTSLQNWHVFFYLHQDFIATSSHLPVTVQFDFHQVSYKVSIVKCQDSESPECSQYSVLNSTLVVHPKENNRTVYLPIWSNPGGYAVTVEVVSDQCPSETGCYVAVSPKFEIKPRWLGVWITIGMAFFLISFLTFLLIFNHRLQINKRILQALREVQPSVLMVYLPETQHHLEFITMFAEFLEHSCHLLPYLVDRDVGIQDPNCWTREQIIRADKVLFIVPGKSEAESITPIRNQWIIALNYLSGHHFTIRQVTRKVAVVIIPSSGNIPCEILHANRFKLVDEIGPLVTWLHNGTWLDEMFLWRPHISSSNEKTGHTWPKVRNAAIRASLPTGILSANLTSSLSYSNIFLTNTNDQVISLQDDESIHSEESTATESASHKSVSAFDPDIPSIDKLYVKEKSSTSSVSGPLSNGISDSDEDGIFT